MSTIPWLYILIKKIAKKQNTWEKEKQNQCYITVVLKQIIQLKVENRMNYNKKKVSLFKTSGYTDNFF